MQSQTNNPIALELALALTCVFNGSAFPSIDSPECSRVMLALGAACEDAESVQFLGAVAVGLLAQRAQQSIQVQREHAEQLRAKATIQ
jgi:hypothetical protein